LSDAKQHELDGLGVVLALGLLSLLLRLVPWPAYLPISPYALSNPLTFEALSSALWPILVGGAIAILIGRGAVRSAGISRLVVILVERARCAVLVPTGGVMRIDWAASGARGPVRHCPLGGALTRIPT
jgi:hypothetical protein